jgi:secreted Zn-dependent insulinase-like peptidase
MMVCALSSLSDVQIEPWFETPFKVETIQADVLKNWADPPLVDPGLHMPLQNVFIPHDFTVFTSREDVSKHPSCLIDSAALKVWHRSNRRFKTPRINVCFSIMFWPASKQISEAVLAELYLFHLTTQLNETLYLVSICN